MAVAAPAPAPRLRSTIVALCHRMAHDLFGTYRPELHYMRGPGPKCREKRLDETATATPAAYSEQLIISV